MQHGSGALHGDLGIAVLVNENAADRDLKLGKVHAWAALLHAFSRL